MNNRYTYLIMTYNEFGILEEIIFLLDDSRNNLYVYINSNVENFNFKY